MQKLWFVPAIAVALLAAPAQAQQGVRKEVISVDSLAKGKPVSVPVEVFIPDGAAERAAAMVILHGSGGVTDQREYGYAREFTKMGVVSVIPDSFTPRGVKSTVADQAAVPSLEMAGDIMRILAAVAKHPRIDPARIGVVGFSKGGTAALQVALAAQAERHTPGGPRFALHVAFYPACDTQYLNVTTTGAPVRVLIGERDTYVGSKPCLDYVAKIKAGGGDIAATVYPQAEHDWDKGTKAWNNSAGENYSKCVFIEQPDRSWVEQTSGVTIIAAGGKPVSGARDQAYAKCRTSGVAGGPHEATRVQSLADLQAFMQSALKL